MSEIIASLQDLFDRRRALLAQLAALDESIRPLLKTDAAQHAVQVAPTARAPVQQAALPEIEDRRKRIIEAVTAKGPIFTSQLRVLPALSDITLSTLSNDLYALGKRGVLRNTDDGWAVASGPEQEGGCDDIRPADPFVQTSR